MRGKTCDRIKHGCYRGNKCCQTRTVIKEEEVLPVPRSSARERLRVNDWSIK